MTKSKILEIIKTVDCHLFELLNSLMCSICHELLLKPLCTPCGHFFCNDCIKTFLLDKNNSGCPLCKNPIKIQSLKSNKLKSKLSEICRVIPSAFLNDVKDLNDLLNIGTEDVVKALKLSSVFYQKNDSSKKQGKFYERTEIRRQTKQNYDDASVEKTKNLVSIVTRNNETSLLKGEITNDILPFNTFTVDVKRNSLDAVKSTKTVDAIEKNTSKEKANSISGENFENDFSNDSKKSKNNFKKIKNESENIIHSQSTTHVGSDGKKSDIKTSSMIRIDYQKSDKSQIKANRNFKGKMQKSTESDEFTSIQKFKNKSMSKKNLSPTHEYKKKCITNANSFSHIKNNKKIIETGKSTDCSDQYDKEKNPRVTKRISQEFFPGTGEEKEKNRNSNNNNNAANVLIRTHDTKFTDEDFNEKNSDPFTHVAHFRFDDDRNRETLGKKEKTSCIYSVELKNNKVSSSSSHFDFENLKSQEAVEVEISLDDYLRRNSTGKTLDGKKQKCFAIKTTKLMTLLGDLVKGGKIHLNSTFSQNSSLKNDIRDLNVEDRNIIYGETANPIGVNNVRLETYSDSFQKNLFQYNNKGEKKFVIDSFEKGTKPGTPSYDFFKRINGNGSFFINFLQLGRLTPSNKRSKSSVVKLVFPLGFNSFFKKRTAFNKKLISPRIPEHFRKTSDTNQGVVKTSTITTANRFTQILPNFNSVETQTNQLPVCSPRMGDFEKRNESTAEKESGFAKIFDAPNYSKYSVRKSDSNYKRPDIITDKKYDFFDVAEKEESQLKCQKIITGKKRNCDSPAQDSVPSKHRKMEDTIKISENLKFESEEMSSFERENDEKSSCVSSKNLLKIEIPSYKFKAETNVNDSNDIRTAKKSVTEKKTFIPNVFSNSKSFDSERLGQKKQGIDFGVGNEATTTENENCNTIVDENEKSDDESDSDFFVEQTPPRCNYLNLDENKLSKSRSFNKNAIVSDISKMESKLCGKILSETENSEGKTRAAANPGVTVDESRFEGSASNSSKATETLVQNSNFKKCHRQSKGFENFSNAIIETETKIDASNLRTSKGYENSRVSFWETAAKVGKKNEYCIVASSVKNPDTIRKFTLMFNMKYCDKPTKNMTHLIVGLHENEDGEILPLCTPKFLYALANKKWIVSESWAETCIKYKTIVSEESFETCDPIGGSGCRNARLSNDRLFKNCEIHLFGTFENISKEELSDLVLDSGGKLVPKPEKFSFSSQVIRMIIADKNCLNLSPAELKDMFDKYKTVILSRDMIIMSVQCYKLSNFYPFLLHFVPNANLIEAGYPEDLLAR